MPEAESAQPNRGSIDRLVARVQEARGIDLGLYRRAYLERRLAARMRFVGVQSYRRYGDMLVEDPAEYAQLLDTLTINVTEFFRDSVVWSSIRRNVMPELIARKRDGRNRTIRVWSAGCATGEEPYSIAMLLLDMLGPEANRFLISVLASDLDPEALKVAEKGVYDTAKLKGISPQYRLRFTRALSATEFEIAPEVKRLVRFRRMSLFDEAPIRVIDLIMCRNVFIYFDREQQARVLKNFDVAMSRGGYLVLGRSEKLSADAAVALEPIDGKERVYRKRGAH